MDCKPRIEGAQRRHRPGRIAATSKLVLLIGAALASPARADSQLQSAPATGRAPAATAHLDFRVTVLPSLSLSMQSSGLRVQGTGGALTVQRSLRDAPDGSAPRSHALLRPRHQVIDSALPQSGLRGAELVTIASP